jgi:hypothetical protein
MKAALKRLLSIFWKPSTKPVNESDDERFHRLWANGNRNDLQKESNERQAQMTNKAISPESPKHQISPFVRTDYPYLVPLFFGGSVQLVYVPSQK